MSFIPERDVNGRMKVSNTTELDSCIEEDLAFTCSTQLITIAGTTETPILLCKYPTGLTTSAKFRSFCIGLNSTTTRGIVRFYRNPTITGNGTELTAQNSHFKSAQSSADLDVFKSPTTSNNGTFLNMLLYRAGSSTSIFNKEYLLDTEQNLLITIQNNEVSKDVHIDIDWLEL